MAEKTQNKDIIYVFSQELICNNCKDWYEHIDPLDKPNCDNCEDIADLPHISRQEAVERMAKAIDEAYLNRNPDYIFHFGLLAEAALNALLENE